MFRRRGRKKNTIIYLAVAGAVCYFFKDKLVELYNKVIKKES